MPMRRLAMRTLREILRLKWDCQLTDTEIARSCGVARSTVFERVARGKLAGLTWPLPDDVDDAALEALLYPQAPVDQEREPIDFEHIHNEMSRRGVTLQLLWQEYREKHGARGYQYTQFTVRYRAWRKSIDVVMHQTHRAGEKLFVDFAGQTVRIDDGQGGVRQAQIFVATLAASNYTYAEALPDQSIKSWIRAHVNAFAYFEGAPAVIVPDNLKAGVTKACYYEPQLNPTYADLAEHYGSIVIPTRVRKPRDKAKVENGVLQVERWVLAPLRDHRFFGLREANEAIAERLEWLNSRTLSGMTVSRRDLWSSTDRPALRPLPTQAFVITHWKCNVGVNIDYHADFDGHYYSVPYQLALKRVDIRATDTTVECLHSGRRVALHQRRVNGERYVTDPSHRPKAHQRHADWSPSRLIGWAQTIGVHTGNFVAGIMERRPHPEQGYRACLGVIRLSKRYDKTRLESACARACALETYSYKSIETMLRTGMDKMPLETISAKAAPLQHKNIRGAQYYKKEDAT